MQFAYLRISLIFSRSACSLGRARSALCGCCGATDARGLGAATTFAQISARVSDHMALINCPECNTQVSSAAPSCPKCGFPIAQHAEPAEGAKPKPDLTEARVEKPKKPTWRRMASLVPPALLGLVVIYVLVVLTLNRCHEDRSEATATHAPRPTETREAQRETQEAQRCDEYKRGIKAAMPDPIRVNDFETLQFRV